MLVTEEIVDAIEGKKNISFNYQGHIRLCSPHAIGLNAGKTNMVVYQFGGMTSKGPVTGDSAGNWRCMDVSQIVNLEVIGGEWHSFENHSTPSKCIDTMLAEVAY